MPDDRIICLGQFAGAHGVRGLVRLRSFTEDPEAIFDYRPLKDESGERKFKIALRNAMNDYYVVSVAGVTTREEAEALRGVRLHVARASLPKTKEREYYQADLAGLAARGKDGAEFGSVLAVHDYGAGPFLEIGHTKKDSFMLPFTDRCVPEVNLAEGFIQVDPPEGWLDKGGQEKEPRPDAQGRPRKNR